MTARRCLFLFLFIPSLSVLTGCGGKNTFVAPPPPEVDVQTPLIEDTTVFLEFPDSEGNVLKVIQQPKEG